MDMSGRHRPSQPGKLNVASQLKQAALHDLLQEGYLFLDPHWRIEVVNPIAARLLEIDAEVAVGQDFFSLVKMYPNLEARDAFDKSYFTALREQGRVYRSDQVIVGHKSNASLNVSMAFQPLYQEREYCGAIMTLHSHQAITQAQPAMIYDSLTGLLTRKEFQRQTQELLNANVSKQHALLYMDLDHFKVINDSCGHLAGDELLGQVAKAIKSVMRKTDICGRLGDDEFAILLKHCNSKQAIGIAENLREVMRRDRFMWEGQPFLLTASIGIVPIDHQIQDTDVLLNKADSTCQLAKDSGRDRIYAYRDQDEALAIREGEITTIGPIHKALAEDRFCLYFQAIQALGVDKKPTLFYEVLVRMIGDEQEVLLPGRFLPAAERYNVISAIDRWVIRRTCEVLAEQDKTRETQMFCSINLSGQSLNDVRMCDDIIQIITETQAPPDNICFEITETGAIANLSNAVAFIDKMKRLGISFALDDFGSGLCSFAYLKNLDVDFIKIDGQFVRDIATNEINTALVKSINEIGHLMGKRTVAEFVEDQDCADKLKSLGVDYAQGFGIAKPLPLDQL